MALTENNYNMADNGVVAGQNAEKIAELENSTPAVQNTEFDGDINLSAIRKKRFRIDGDNNRYLELDVSDMTIINRLESLYPKLEKLSQDAALKQLDKEDADDEKSLTRISNTLTKIDAQMRQILDEIFDSDVSAKCAPSGSMFDPFNGTLRFEHIIDVLSKLYENNINSEFKKMSARMKKRTSKYTKKH